MTTKPWIVLAAVACLALGVGAAVAQDWKADTSMASPGHSLQSAKESLAAGYYTGAVADLSMLVMRVPADAEVYFLLGAAHWGNGNPVEARKALKRALELDPGLEARLHEYPLGPGDQGRISLAAAPQPARSVSAPASAAVSAPTRPAADNSTPAIGTAAYFLRYGRIALENGDGPGAAKYAREALAVDPNNAEAKRMLAASASVKAPKRTCQQIWSSCWVSARDYSDKMACNQRDIVCKANER